MKGKNGSESLKALKRVLIGNEAKIERLNVMLTIDHGPERNIGVCSFLYFYFCYIRRVNMYLVLLIGSVITASGATYILTKHYFNNRKNIGDLIVTSDEDGQYLSLSLYRDYSDYISDGEYITLQVKELSR